MKHDPVKSSHIKSVAHDPEQQVLEIKFMDGSTHEYHGVPAEVHKAMVASKSVGQFFNSKVKHGYMSRKK